MSRLFSRLGVLTAAAAVSLSMLSAAPVSAAVTPPDLPNAAAMAVSVGMPKGSLKAGKTFGIVEDDQQLSWGINFLPVSPKKSKIKSISSVTIPNVTSSLGLQAWVTYIGNPPKGAKIVTNSPYGVVWVYTSAGKRVGFVAQRKGDVGAVAICEALPGTVTDKALIDCASGAQAAAHVFSRY